jgi:hypothetical protein
MVLLRPALSTQFFRPRSLAEALFLSLNRSRIKWIPFLHSLQVRFKSCSNPFQVCLKNCVRLDRNKDCKRHSSDITRCLPSFMKAKRIFLLCDNQPEHQNQMQLKSMGPLFCNIYNTSFYQVHENGHPK